MGLMEIIRIENPYLNSLLKGVHIQPFVKFLYSMIRLRQGLWASAHRHGAAQPVGVLSCPWWDVSSAPGLYPLDASSSFLLPDVTTKTTSRQGRVSPDDTQMGATSL